MDMGSYINPSQQQFDIYDQIKIIIDRLCTKTCLTIGQIHRPISSTKFVSGKDPLTLTVELQWTIALQKIIKYPSMRILSIPLHFQCRSW